MIAMGFLSRNSFIFSFLLRAAPVSFTLHSPILFFLIHVQKEKNVFLSFFLKKII